MKEPRTSTDGNCPQCAADDYRLASACHAAQPTPEVAPPVTPDDYASKGNRLINCAKRLHTAAKVRNCYWLLKEKFEDDCVILRECHDYEQQRALWERTRVCQCCGVHYVRDEDRQAAVASFDMPIWTVELA